MFKHATHLRVRYGETDKMGYLYYGNYAEYYEVGRVEAIRALGLSYKEMEEKDGIWLPVVHLEMRFVRPIYYDELITVQSIIKKMPDNHLTFHVEIFNEQGKLANGGRVRLCFFDAKTKEVVPAPQNLIEKLTPYFEKS
jgi:acyl-CoA thioester hydrolase